MEHDEPNMRAELSHASLEVGNNLEWIVAVDSPIPSRMNIEPVLGSMLRWKPGHDFFFGLYTNERTAGRS